MKMACPSRRLRAVALTFSTHESPCQQMRSRDKVSITKAKVKETHTLACLLQCSAADASQTTSECFGEQTAEGGVV